MNFSLIRQLYVYMENAKKDPIYLRRRTIAGMIVFVLALVVFGAINFLSGCADKPVQIESASTGIQSDSTTALPVDGSSASYGMSFDNFAELCAASDMVVLGVVDRVIERRYWPFADAGLARCSSS